MKIPTIVAIVTSQLATAVFAVSPSPSAQSSQDVAKSELEIRSLTEVINGHSTGGVAVDAVGDIYVADFGDIVWKITPDRERQVFASGLYGASGNTIDNEGNLLQSNFYGNSITKIDRNGLAKPFATTGLSGPVGIAINKQTGELYVANCRGTR
jgi:DNA-binding beta-propeller fold protein YncE